MDLPIVRNLPIMGDIRFLIRLVFYVMTLVFKLALPPFLMALLII